MMNYDKDLLLQELQQQQFESELISRRLARNNFRDFIPHIRPQYSAQWFHEVIADKLQAVYERKIQKLMIFVPPQHGKSELSTRSFPAWILGRSPNTKILIASYSSTLASSFNRDIQLRMDDEPYLALFPDTRLNGSNVVTVSTGGTLRNSEIFGVVGHEGFVKTVGVGGSLTGTSVDIGIIDDPIKDRADAQSLTIRESTWNWYTDVFETRLHNHSAQVMILTRWEEDDPAGRALDRDGLWSSTNPYGWHVISFPALRTKDQSQYDPRPVGAALWPERHSQEKIEKVKRDNPFTFNSMYQQDPKPSEESLVFPNWIEIDEMPHCDSYFNVIDFGYSIDPTFIGKVGRSGRNLYVDEIAYTPGLMNPDILDLFHAAGLDANIQTICDRAERKSVDELSAGYYKPDGVKVAGINAIPSEKGPGSVIAGISKLNEYTVHYTRRSRNIGKEVRNYKYIMLNGKPTNDPIDRWNHAMDAIRGGVWTIYGKPPVEHKSSATRITVQMRSNFGGGGPARGGRSW
ncbi:terminase large subunit domain-containing protein [Larkinella terrae]|uniref:Phage terminase large subunit n=1 Tax=Larkinella terrae TaxID=2025311 RepID=A0A7K0EIW3_9BACT|nr:terminase family protein [Larkinella terrae]MRS61672.1 hypothetical protein [Larkinella terrae]